MTKYKHQSLGGETLHLGMDLKTQPVLGPDLVLEGCTVVNEVGADVIIAGLTMTGGTWRQESPWRDAEIDRARFRDVRFEGQYSGVTFGNWDAPEAAGLEGCDFSAATLDGIRFLHGGHKALTLPSWPHFAVDAPAEAYAALSGLALGNGSLEIDFEVILDQDPSCTLVVENAQAIADRAKVSLQDVRAIVEQLPGATIL